MFDVILGFNKRHLCVCKGFSHARYFEFELSFLNAFVDLAQRLASR